MFAAYCPTHGSEILLGYRRLIGLRNTTAGIDIHLLCYCGEHLVVPTGRARSERVARTTTDTSEASSPAPKEPSWADDVGRRACA
jgi:hypothetical protein